jgi:hypothetical protein
MKKNGCNNFSRENLSLLNSGEISSPLRALLKAVYPFRRSLSFCTNIIGPLVSLFPFASRILVKIERILENEECYLELMEKIKGD